MNKQGCIVALSQWNDDRVLFKNRDRNYRNCITFHHELRHGVEVLYFKDALTGWIEGMNQYGIGIINATLMPSIDESRLKDSAKGDGEIILKALEQKTVEDAMDMICGYKNGLYGHTIISNADKSYSVEHFEGEEPVCKEINPNEDVHVRTNHGIDIPHAGVQNGNGRKSTITRRLRALKALRNTESKESIIENIYKYRPNGFDDPHNMVRNLPNGLKTGCQYVIDPQEKTFNFYTLPYKVRILGYKCNVVKPRLKLNLFRICKEDGQGNFKLEPYKIPKETNPFLKGKWR